MSADIQELVAFVRARLDEDEWWAREASRGPSYWPICDRGMTGDHWQWVDPDGDTVLQLDPVLDEDVLSGSLRSVEEYPTSSVGDLPHFVIHRAEEMPTAAAVHIARHDPARVLRDVEAKRRILANVSWASDNAALTGDAWWNAQTTGALLAYENAARALAQAYDTHPDYREEWRP